MNHKKRVLVIGTSVGAGDVPPLRALVTGLIERKRERCLVHRGPASDWGDPRCL